MAQQLASLKLKNFKVPNAYLTKFAVKAGQDKDQTHSFSDPRTNITPFGTLHNVPMGFVIPVDTAKKLIQTITEELTGQWDDGQFYPYEIPGSVGFKYGFLTKILKKDKEKAIGMSTDTAMFRKVLESSTVDGQNAYELYTKKVAEYLENIIIIEPDIPITGSGVDINPEKFTLVEKSTGQTIQVGSLFKAGNNKELQRISDMVEKAKISGFLDISVSWGDKNNSIYTNYTLTSALIKEQNAYGGAVEEFNKRLGAIAGERRNASKLLSLEDGDDFDFEDSPSPVKEESDSLFG